MTWTLPPQVLPVGITDSTQRGNAETHLQIEAWSGQTHLQIEAWSGQTHLQIEPWSGQTHLQIEVWSGHTETNHTIDAGPHLGKGNSRMGG